MGYDLTKAKFDENIEASNNDVLPAGWYPCRIDKVEQKQTKDQTGEYLNIMFKVDSGESQVGRTFFEMYNTRNKSADAERIGQSKLCALTEASIGKHLSKVENTDEFAGAILMVKLKIIKEEGYGDKNQVVAYKSMAKFAESAKPSKEKEKLEIAPPKPKVEGEEDEIPF